MAECQLSSYDARQYVEDMRLGPSNSLQVVLKVAERCNIACKYCYFFFGGDDSYKDNPAYISEASAEDVCRLVREAIDEFSVGLVRIIIHGGEPLMLKKARMQMLLDGLQLASSGAELQLTVQTNAMLIDDEWIDLFEHYNVYVGVSLDGPKEVNDLNRIDKRHRGTYERTLAGISKLFAAHKSGRLARPGLLCVVNPEVASADTLYDHFVVELGFRNIDFLLPDENHDTMSPERADLMCDFMMRLLERYTAEERDEVRIRFFDKVINAMTMAPFFASVLRRYHAQRDVVFTISSKGDIAPDDILRTCDPALMRIGLNVASSGLRDVLASVKMARLNDEAFTVPEPCTACEWANVCSGGDLYHRYRSGEGFNNRSVYCSTLRAVHERVAEIVHGAGVPLHVLEKRLRAMQHAPI